VAMSGGEHAIDARDDFRDSDGTTLAGILLH
jgi:hypothetical protein